MSMICPIKNKLETNRWLHALQIAKVVFDDEGYHILYLEQIENFIKENRMYSPKVKNELIPALYITAKKRRIPITKLVNGIIEQYLEKNMEMRQDQKKAVVLGTSVSLLKHKAYNPTTY